MNIGITSYPMLYQRPGGLQNQIDETIKALSRKGIKIRRIDFLKDKLSNFDIIHVFSAINGNFRIIQEAKFQAVPIILSPLHQPIYHGADYIRFKFCSKFTARVSNYQLKTSYDETKVAMDNADFIISQSFGELRTICKLYGKKFESHIKVIPNGVADVFFSATPELFNDKNHLPGPFIFIAGTISSYKNQLGVIKATETDGWPIVLAGPIVEEEYFKNCIEMGSGRVSYIGSFDYLDPLLLSCYSAAAVTVLVSQGETFGMTIVESLAAGTPAIITKNTGLAIPAVSPILTYVNPNNKKELRNAIRKAIGSNSCSQDCKVLVRHLSWSSIADAILNVYFEVYERNN